MSRVLFDACKYLILCFFLEAIMRKQDSKVMVAFEGMALAATQHHSDSVLVLHGLMAASTMAEGIDGDEARKLEELIDACVITTKRTLDQLAIYRNELHEITGDIRILLQAQQARISEKEITHDHRG